MALGAQCRLQLARIDAWLAELEARRAHGDDRFAGNLALARRRLKNGVGQSPDVVVRDLTLPGLGGRAALIAYIEGMVDDERVEQGVVARLLATRRPPAAWGQRVLTAGSVVAVARWSDLLARLTAGDTLVFAEGHATAWAVSTAKYHERAIGRPKTEMVVRGPDEAFTEALTTKIAQLRRYLPRPDLRLVPVAVGGQPLAAAVAYLEGTANPALVEAVVERLQRLRVAVRPNATAVGGMIRDHPLSIFPTIRSTERVGLAAWRLIEGKALVLVDGDPFVLVAPAPIIDFYRTEMDYGGAWYDTSFVRAVRIVGWAIGVYLPALYIAATEVNLNVIPANLLITIAGSRGGLPASPLAEVLIMVLVIEMLREAAMRLPGVLGTTIGTVGAIVLGTAVVRAGFISPQVIVLITLTALAFYTSPVYELTGSWRLVNFTMLILAALLGVLGIVLGSVVLLGELTRLTSFGTPYFEPWAPFRPLDWGNAVLRLPYRLLTRRPTAARPLDPVWARPQSASAVTPHLRTGRAPP